MEGGMTAAGDMGWSRVPTTTAASAVGTMILRHGRRDNEGAKRNSQYENMLHRTSPTRKAAVTTGAFPNTQ